ncbi:ornithine cyclodeaminase family protein [Lutimonas saemankumensis]|uniref:ornithine cyclodeaminase family protein n=1 Tax=Lutimonas saemankumensis TaxID=483016 RepID=UPI001CD394B8|nr:ornithine cyclodeaminase family protein [Lutimonas saemankumensis]MCA0933393.1 ornithine cyclodeaminase family protein [Lutimonas saemankumensis]
MGSTPFISNDFIESHTDFGELIETLRSGFGENQVETPMRHHHDYANPKENIDSTLLLMPSWEAGIDLGVKIVSVNPNNGNYGLPSIQGTYLYLNAHNGSLNAIFDAKALTAKRTAAASALAASYLAHPKASTLLMLGTGVLSSNLIKAHATVSPLKKVYIWGRSYDKALKIARLFEQEDIEVIPVKDYDSYIHESDIISTATLSADPLIDGTKLRNGQHLDLVGAYKKDMREADDACVLRSSIFLDTFQGGLKESGDIAIPLHKGLLKKEDIKADLFGLCGDRHPGRENSDEITLFKSVGHASEDLFGARYYFEQYKKDRSKR